MVLGLKLRVTIGGWCVTLQVSLLRSNILAASRTLQKRYASCVSTRDNQSQMNRRAKNVYRDRLFSFYGSQTLDFLNAKSCCLTNCFHI